MGLIRYPSLTEFWAWLASSAGTVVLALIAGAGGSALLELIWRPLRDRRRAARLVIAEFALNTELLLLQAHARFASPAGVPSDFSLSTIAWTSAGDLISELPPKLLRQLVLLYNHYLSLNRNVAFYGDVLSTFDAAKADSAEKLKAEKLLLGTIDVFNTGIDSTIELGQQLLPEMRSLARIRESEDEKAQVVNYAERAASLIAGRQQRIANFKNRFKRP